MIHCKALAVEHISFAMFLTACARKTHTNFESGRKANVNGIPKTLTILLFEKVWMYFSIALTIFIPNFVKFSLCIVCTYNRLLAVAEWQFLSTQE